MGPSLIQLNGNKTPTPPATLRAAGDPPHEGEGQVVASEWDKLTRAN
jgi:hypothetical protein